MTVLTEGAHTAECIISEAALSRSRETVTLAAGQNLAAGAVLGRLTKRQAAAPIPTVSGTSPGDGTMTGLSCGPEVQVGTYVLACITTASNGGVFSVTAPDGTALANATVGTAYKSRHLNFTLVDGANDFTTAARFNVVVTAGGTPAVVATATANGVMSAITLGPLAQHGTYKVLCTAAGTTHGGTFEVFAPDGAQIGTIVMADTASSTSAFTSAHVNFTIADGSNNYAAGDYFNIIVATHTEQVKAWDPTAVDGTELAVGVLHAAVNATSAAKAGVAVVRDAQVDSAALTWGAAVTAGQKPTAMAQLAAHGLIVR